MVFLVVMFTKAYDSSNTNGSDWKRSCSPWIRLPQESLDIILTSYIIKSHQNIRQNITLFGCDFQWGKVISLIWLPGLKWNFQSDIRVPAFFWKLLLFIVVTTCNCNYNSVLSVVITKPIPKLYNPRLTWIRRLIFFF